MSDDNTGPTHYEGWSCGDCKYLEHSIKSIKTFKCNSPDISKDVIKYMEPIFLDIANTPSWCPYIRDAIMKRVMECD